MQSWVDHVDNHQMRGWAFDPTTPRQALWLDVIIDDNPPIAFCADMFRADLLQPHFPTGHFGFHVAFEPALDPRQAHTIHIRRRSDGQNLANTPCHLPCAIGAGALARAELAGMIAAEIEAARHASDLDATLDSVLQRADQILQIRTEITKTDTAPRPETAALQWALLVTPESPPDAQTLTIIAALKSLGFAVASTVSHTGGAPNAATLTALHAADVRVLAPPLYHTVEDVLQRGHAMFAVVILRGAINASTYGTVSRHRQPKATVIAWLGNPPIDGSDPVLTLGAALASDVVFTATAISANYLSQLWPHQHFNILTAPPEPAALAEYLASVLPLASAEPT